MRSASPNPMTLLLASLMLAPASAWAVDGVIEINHARALAGGVTPGDGPGYPVTISQPGSYRLTSNLTQPDVDTHVIDASSVDTLEGVSVDLNGFSILGGTACTPVGGNPPTSVDCSGAGSGVGVFLATRVSNGAVKGMGGDCIKGGRVSDVTLSDCGGSGVAVGLALRDARIERTGQNGVSGFGRLQSVVVRHAGAAGIAWTGRIKDSHVIWSVGAGFNAAGEAGSVLTGSVASENRGAGVLGSSSLSYGGNTVRDNQGGTVTGGAVQVGLNNCDGDTACP